MRLYLMVAGIAAGPTLVTTGLFAYLQASLGFEVKPQYIIGGIMTVLMLSMWILQREARRVFSLIDTVPKLSSDVSAMKDDISEIKKVVDGIPAWRERIETILEERLPRRG